MKWKIEHTEENEGDEAFKVKIYDVVGNPADVSSTILVFCTSYMTILVLLTATVGIVILPDI